MNLGYFLSKGLRKVRGELGFSVIIYNLKRAISLKGVNALFHRLRDMENDKSLNLCPNPREIYPESNLF
jgi:hypothetical protein